MIKAFDGNEMEGVKELWCEESMYNICIKIYNEEE